MAIKIPAGERVLWRGKPSFVVYALKMLPFSLIGVVWTIAYLPLVRTMDPAGLLDFFGFVGYFFVFGTYLPVIIGVLMTLAPFIIVARSYPHLEYAITNKAVISPTWSGHFEQMSPVKRRMDMGQVNTFFHLPKDSIVKVEVKRGLFDRLFGTHTLWIYFPHSMYQKGSGFHKVIMFKNVRDAQHVRSLLR